MIVITKCDQLVRVKEAALREDNPFMQPTTVHELGVEEAQKTFGIWLGVLRRKMNRLGIPMPPCVTVSGMFAPSYYLVLTACQFIRNIGSRFYPFWKSLEMLLRRKSKTTF